MVKHRLVTIICLLGVVISGCQPAVPSVSPSQEIPPTSSLPTITATATAIPKFTPSPTTTQKPRLTATPSPSPTATLIPGPDFYLLYLANGTIYRYKFHDWLIERVRGTDISIAALSTGKNYLAFADQDGLFITQWPDESSQLRIPSTGEVSQLLFSENDRLAYSDHQGLKIYDPKTEETKVLIEQNIDIDINYPSRYLYYSPSKWSPNGNWLWVNVTHWEGVSRALVNVKSGNLIEYDGCYEDIDWSTDSSSFVTSVFPSAYLLCGNNSGVFVFTLSGSKPVEELVYADRGENWLMHEPHYASWNPAEDQILFVQNTWEEEPQYHLLLIDYSTRKVQELDNSLDEIVSPRWSDDGNKIYYVIHKEEESLTVTMDLHTLEKTVSHGIQTDIQIIQQLSADDWLILKTFHHTGPDYLYLFNAQTSQLVFIVSTGGNGGLDDSFIGNEPGY